MKPYVKIALFFVLIIAIVSILIGLSMYFKKHSDLATTKPDYVITATALQKEFEDNEKSASEKYITKILEVSGNVASVTQADSSNINISLKTESDLSSVICTFAGKDLSKFKTGEDLKIRGECSGFLMDVLLNNCAVIK
jgi:hypothetical protein